MGRDYDIACVNPDSNITLSGTLSSDKTLYYSVRVYDCDQDYLDKTYPDDNLTCKSKEEIEEMIRETSFFITVLSKYFDPKSYDS